MRYPQLMHPSVNRCTGFDKGTFQIREMVQLAVMVSRCTGIVPGSSLTDVRQIAIDKRQHILGGFQIEHPPLATASDVNRRSMGENPPSPAIVMGNTGIIGTCTSGGNPRMPIHLHLCLQRQSPRTFIILRRSNNAPCLNNLERMNRKNTLRPRFDLHRTSP